MSLAAFRPLVELGGRELGSGGPEHERAHAEAFHRSTEPQGTTAGP